MLKVSPESLGEVEVAAPESSRGPDVGDSVTEPLLEITEDRLRVVGSKGVECLQDISVEYLSFAGEKTEGKRDMPASIKKSVYGEKLGEELSSRFEGSVDDKMVCLQESSFALAPTDSPPRLDLKYIYAAYSRLRLTCSVIKVWTVQCPIPPYLRSK